jgi:hypothetical protein
MQALRDLRRPRVLHPFLLAACPVVALYGQNAATLTLERVYPSLLVFLAATFVVWLILSRACGDIHRAGAATSVFLLTGFLAWPILETVIEIIVPVREALPTVLIGACITIAIAAASVAWWVYIKTRVGRAAIVIALAVVLLMAIAMAPAFGRRAAILIALYIAGSGFVAQAFLVFRGDRFRLTSTGNVFGFALIVLYLGYALLQERAQSILPDWPPPTLAEQSIFDVNDVPLEQPDVFVLALDGYPRADVLTTAFQFDNTAFLESLSSQGFTVADGVQTSYIEPVQALASCFNLVSVDAWAPGALAEGSRAHFVQRALDQSRLLPALSKRGYELIGFDSGIEALRPSPQFDQTRKPVTVLGEFERILCRRTIVARTLQLYYYLRYGNPAYWQFEPTRRYVDFVLDELPSIAGDALDDPRFVFAYMPIPEPPFLFRKDGSRAYPYAIGPLDTARLFFDPQIHRRAFLDQLEYLNSRVLNTVRDIQSNAKRPTVIMIVSLRGAALRGSAEGPPPRAPILAASSGAKVNVVDVSNIYLVNWFQHLLKTAVESGAE